MNKREEIKKEKIYLNIICHPTRITIFISFGDYSLG